MERLMKRPIGVLVFVMLVLTIGAFTAMRGASTSNVPSSDPQAPGHLHHRVGSVVGAETPEAIPDEMAYNMMLRLLGSLADAPDGTARAAGYIRWIERHSEKSLTAEDSAALQSIARSHRAQARETERRVKVGDLQAYSGESARQGQVRSSMARLRAELTPEGSAIVETFVQRRVKTRMKILR